MDSSVIEIFASSLKKAEKNLNDAHHRFHSEPLNDLRDFLDIKLQCCIFQYDLCREMVSVTQQRPQGFAESVALKGLVHKLFEYEVLVKKALRPKLLALASSRNIEIDHEALAELDSQTRPALKKLRSWHGVRNKAAGHYDADIHLQTNLIETLTFDHVMEVACDFIRYNMGLLIILRDAGSGPAPNTFSPS
jgi:hypothetical protein